MRYTTAAGQTVEVTGGAFKAYMYCHGCGPGSGRKVPRDKADQIANQHANSCRRTPGEPARRHSHTNSSR